MKFLIMVLTVFFIFLSGCSDQRVSREEKILFKQIKNLEVEDVKRLVPSVISNNLLDEPTLDHSRVLDVEITPKNYKVANNYIEAALSIWDFLYSVDNSPIKIGRVQVHGTGDVFFADVAEKYVVISRDQYELIKDLPRAEAYKYFPIYQGYSSAKKRLLPCVEGFCHDENGQKYRDAYKSIQTNLGTDHYIDFIEKYEKIEGMYWFFTYQYSEDRQKYSNHAIWEDEHSIYSVGLYDETQKRIVDMKKIQDIELEVKESFKLRNDETISYFDYTYFSHFLYQGSDYSIDFWISNKEGNAFVPVATGLRVEDGKIRLIPGER